MGTPTPQSALSCLFFANRFFLGGEESAFGGVVPLEEHRLLVPQQIYSVVKLRLPEPCVIVDLSARGERGVRRHYGCAVSMEPHRRPMASPVEPDKAVDVRIPGAC